VPRLLRQIQNVFAPSQVGISTVGVIELTHGIYRFRTNVEQARRQTFVDAVIGDIFVYPLSLEIAQLAGRIEGEQAAKAIGIPFEDLVIGATALHLGFDVLTNNLRHFQLIPGLNAVTF